MGKIWISLVIVTIVTLLLLQIPSAFCTDSKLPLGKRPKQGGTLVIGVSQMEPAHLNVMAGGATNAEMWGNSIFSQLTAMSADHKTILPDLAESWDMSPDGKTYTFHLRRDVKWHDDVPFTSDDVLFTFQQIIKEKLPAISLLRGVVDMTAPDKYTFVLTLEKASTPFLQLFSMSRHDYMIHIMPKHLYEKTGIRDSPQNLRPIGTGPFRLSEYVKGSHVVLVANKDYYGEGPNIDKIIFKSGISVPSLMAQLEAGEVHNFLDQPIAATDIQRLQNLPKLRVLFWDSGNPARIKFNMNRPPTNDLRVRKALSMILDRAEINTKVYLGSCAPYDTAFPAFYGDYYNPNAKYPAKDVEAAKRLLDEAGYPVKADGKRFSLKFVIGQVMRLPEAALIFAEQLKQVGIDAKVESIDWATFTAQVLQKDDPDFDVSMDGGVTVSGPWELAAHLKTKAKDGIRNIMGYSVSRLDALFDSALTEPDPKKVKDMYYEIQDIILRDLPVTNMFYYTYPKAVASDWHDFWFEFDSAGKRTGEYNWNTVWWDGGTAPVLTATTTERPPVAPTPFESYLVPAVAVIVILVACAAFLFRRKRKTP
ncbi:ABC transporter substrate-binding protein [Candidatus Bathyarchaeota archaeon]|nr:ABC transporter substrate-binding protein [Candidatus Bathyarchaeota archaeon]